MSIQTLLLMGFILALLLAVLAALAGVYLLRSNHKLTAGRSESEQKLMHLTRDVEAVTEAMQEGQFLLRLENSLLTADRYFTSPVKLVVSDAMNPVETLLRMSELDEKTVEMILGTLKASFGVTILQWDFNAKVLPKEIKVAEDRKQKILALKWKAIRSKEGLIAKILVLSSDITELRQLQDDARTRYDDAKRLMELIGNSPKKIGEFFSIVESVLADARHATGPENFRNIHTLKGMARGYQLEELSRCLAELENEIQLEPQRPLQHSEALNNTETALRAYKRLFLRVYTQKLASAQVSVDPKLVLGLTQKIEVAFMKSDINEAFSVINEIRAIFATTLDKIIIDEIGMVRKLSEDLGKPYPDLYINEMDLQVSEECKVMLRKVFVHLFRNSMDHGLESENARILSGKEPRGQISVQAMRVEDRYRIRYSDDGQGLDLQKVLQKAIDLGLAEKSRNYSDQEIAELIFESGLSTATRGSSFSGRGVGMDAVRSFLKQGGGHISIQLDPSVEGKGRGFHLTIDVPVKREELKLQKTQADGLMLQALFENRQ